MQTNQEPALPAPVERFVRTCSLIGEMRQLVHDLTEVGVAAVKGKHPAMLWEAARRMEVMEDALRDLVAADLTHRNCASVEIAAERIRRLAKKGLQ